ncbi:hypothetical protein WJX72_006044 [[Myrmecia] bisecta]|uniref:Uncharacterized protein n=1 Tax=[Myrmecia] bisecta TaxID=41462 RepID=A0AAW1PHC9_9CHLO
MVAVPCQAANGLVVQPVVGGHLLHPAQPQTEGLLRSSLCAVRACSLQAFAAVLLESGTPHQVLALQVMFASIQRHDPSADLLALVPATATDLLVHKLSLQRIRAVRLPDQLGPSGGTSRDSGRANAIILAFSLTEYTSIMLVDAHYLLQRGVEDLFACGSFCAALDPGGMLDTRLLVLQPSSTTNRELQAQLPTAVAMSACPHTRRSAEAILLQGVFPSLSSGPECLLGRNAPQTGACRFNATMFQDAGGVAEGRALLHSPR